MNTLGKTWRCRSDSCGRWPTSPGRGPRRPAGWFLEVDQHLPPFERNQQLLDQRGKIWTPARLRRFHLRCDASRSQLYLWSYIVQLTGKSSLAGFWYKGRHCFPRLCNHFLAILRWKVLNNHNSKTQRNHFCLLLSHKHRNAFVRHVKAKCNVVFF